MPTEETTTPDTPQPISESPSPTVESPAPATEPATPPQEAPPTTSTPETASAPAEATPAPETDQPATPTGQIPPNDPLPPEPDPISPPSAAAPQVQPPITLPSPIAPTPIIVSPTGNFIRNLLAKASAKIQSKKKAKLEKILQALNTKNKITNDEVEKLLHVSDATAERYLAVLVKEGKIKQDRKTGAGVTYTKI